VGNNYANNINQPPQGYSKTDTIEFEFFLSLIKPRSIKMETSGIKDRDFLKEVSFIASRSSGPGGQNVNKVNTKVELHFDVFKSNILTEAEKEIIRIKLAGKINSEGEIILMSQSERSQLMNKEKVTEKFYLLIKKALTPVKKRKPTKPPMAAKEKRLDEKKMRAEKKERRNKIND
jgi:ribosome-associated protein